MALKHYNPTSPARRGLILVDRSALHKGKPVKALTEGKRKTGGRNNKGHVTSRGIAGGHKQKYRFIDFKRRKWDVPATVERIEYDPNRTAFIALLKYEAGEQTYIICPQRRAVGDTVVAGERVVLPTLSATWLALAWLIISAIVAFILFVWIIARWTASAATYALVLAPLVTVGLAAWLVHERVTMTFVMGSAVVLIGAYVGAIKSQVRSPADSNHQSKPQPPDAAGDHIRPASQ